MFDFLIDPKAEPNPHEVSKAVLRLSNFYIEHPLGETPWEEEYCQLAYRYYYLPLNAIRAELVLSRGNQIGFFEDLHQFIDWGAGPGTLSLAIAANLQIKAQIKSQVLYDISETVLRKFSDLHMNLVNPKTTSTLNLARVEKKSNTALMFSYSLTEANSLPENFKDFEALIILEPSTRDDGRKLLSIREQLISAGYSIWAPCVHQMACPLLTKSNTDWCHDRANVNAPVWFEKVETLLPMKNRTVTTSYLLARKKKAPSSLSSYARLTGDSLEEKGKTRQLICRGTDREYLAWLHRKKTPQVLDRGILVKLANNSFSQVSNELRLNTDVEVAPQFLK